MKFFIEDALFNDFAPVIGVIVAEDVDNAERSEEIGNLLRTEEAKIRALFVGEGALGSHPSIAAWRKAYKKFGSDSYRCSSEALARRVLKGETIPRINTLVDLYNMISLK